MSRRNTPRMVTGIILIRAVREKVHDVAQQLVGLKEVSEIYSVAGRWDLVAMVRVPSLEALEDVIAGHLAHAGGICQTETLVACRAYSKIDLERLFSEAG